MNQSGRPLIIASTNAEQLLRESPGIYVGRFPIRAFFGIVGHTATAEVSASSIAVTELVGLWTHVFQEIEHHRPRPYYGDFGTYRWIKVAELDRVEAYRQATQQAKAAYHNRLYTASSNRFVSCVLKTSGIPLTREMVSALGSSPGIRWRYRF